MRHATPPSENWRMHWETRAAARTLARRWRFTAMASLLMAVGIATTTVAAEIVYETVFRPSYFPKPSELVWVLATVDERCAACIDDLTPTEYREWHDRLTTLQGLAAFQQTGTTIREDDSSRVAPAAIVTGSFFQLLGARAQVGRLIDASIGDVGAEAVVSQAFARRVYGGSTAAIGRTIHLDGFPFSIVGVLDRSMAFPHTTDVWIPNSAATFLGTGRQTFYQGIGRLAKGVTLERARAAVRPSRDTNSRIRYPLLKPLDAQQRMGQGPLAWVFVGATALSFIVACVNLAALSIVRALDRGRETTIRIALGATAGDLARQAIVESSLLAVMGGGIGIGLAIATCRVIGVTLQLDSGFMDAHGWSGDIAIAGCVLLALIAVASAIGAAPLIHIRTAGIRTALRESASSATTSRSQRTIRQSLVALQVAIAIILGTVATVIAVSLHKLAHVDVGYDADQVVVSAIDLRGTPYAERSQASEVASSIQSLHAGGVMSAPAVWTTTRPSLVDSSSPDGVAIEGRSADLPPGSRLYMSYDVSPGFMRTLGVRLVQGRAFTARDNRSGGPVAIVNEAAARRWWPNESPIGKRIKFGGPRTAAPWMDVVGVVASTQPIEEIGTVLARNTGASGYRLPMIFRPLAEGGELLGTDCSISPCGQLMVGVRADEHDTARSWLKSTLPAAAPGAKITAPRTLRELQLMQPDITNLRSSLRITCLVAVTILLLAVIGLYSVVAETVRRREREIGIRLAIGSTQAGAIRVVASDGFWGGVIGSGLGCAALAVFEPILRIMFLGATDVLPQGLLFGVGIREPSVLAVAATVGIVLTSIASTVGGWKAARVEPGLALRAE